MAIYCSILSYNNETRLINIGDNLRKIFGYVYIRKIYRNFIRVEEFSKIEIEHNTTLKMPSKNSSSKSPLSINNLALLFSCFTHETNE